MGSTGIMIVGVVGNVVRSEKVEGKGDTEEPSIVSEAEGLALMMSMVLLVMQELHSDIEGPPRPCRGSPELLLMLRLVHFIISPPETESMEERRKRRERSL